MYHRTKFYLKSYCCFTSPKCRISFIIDHSMEALLICILIKIKGIHNDLLHHWHSCSMIIITTSDAATNLLPGITQLMYQITEISLTFDSEVNDPSARDDSQATVVSCLLTKIIPLVVNLAHGPKEHAQKVGHFPLMPLEIYIINIFVCLWLYSNYLLKFQCYCFSNFIDRFGKLVLHSTKSFTLCKTGFRS